jgi:hypothetical protein
MPNPVSFFLMANTSPKKENTHVLEKLYTVAFKSFLNLSINWYFQNFRNHEEISNSRANTTNHKNDIFPGAGNRMAQRIGM